MASMLDGIRILEIAQWGFVPSAGAILADWGATVLKVEHPEQGDPIRGLVSGFLPDTGEGLSVYWELFNRGKRGMGVNLSSPEGRGVIHDLAASADVFLTSFLPAARKKLGIDVDDIRQINPRIIYARGTGQGPRGPEAEKGGFDGASFWTRGGLCAMATPPGASQPASPLGGAFGDVIGGMALAGGIAAAIAHRERTGEPAVVDTSLLHAAMWAMSPGISSAKLFGPTPNPQASVPPSPRQYRPTNNPLTLPYRTKDDRFIKLHFLQSDRHWPEFCEAIGRPDLLEDERFADAEARKVNSVECCRVIDEIFGQDTVAAWREKLDKIEGVWAVVQRPEELLVDQQALANDYLLDVVKQGHPVVTVIANPVQFDEQAPQVSAAPNLGEHTDEILLERGMSWDDVMKLKVDGVIN